MKTTDFIGELYELGFGVTFGPLDVHVVKSGFFRRKIARISSIESQDHEINSRRFDRIKPDVRQKLLNLMLEYSNTPIEERR